MTVKAIDNSGFNFKAYLHKQAFYEGVQGYFVAQGRAWSNCAKCKRDAGKTANEAWEECIQEYSGQKSNDDWAYKYGSDDEDKMKIGKAVATETPKKDAEVTESQLGKRDNQGPEQVSERQLDTYRDDDDKVLTEKQLAKVRKEASAVVPKDGSQGRSMSVETNMTDVDVAKKALEDIGFKPHVPQGYSKEVKTNMTDLDTLKKALETVKPEWRGRIRIQESVEPQEFSVKISDYPAGTLPKKFLNRLNKEYEKMKGMQDKTSGFNFRAWLSKRAKDEQVTESQLGKRDNQGPEQVAEKQLEAQREEPDGEVITERQLDKVRKDKP